ncbi:MAG: DNA-binding domain-containing protein [Burkholderiales bacterium]|nr:DNA-binding domain-containing protein [Burkholderiales bacterium]
MSASLEALQLRFAAGILAGDRAILDALRPHRGLDAARRLGIYREAYRARLADALADTFGHTARYLGDAEFDTLARGYIAAHAPSAYSIRWYGATFPAWLRRARAQDAALAELAALDWALRAAFDSADVAPLDATALAELTPEAWGRVGFRPHPSFRLLTLRWNTVALWQAIEREDRPPATQRLPRPATLAVWRLGVQPHFRTLEPDEDRALRALRAGTSFGAVCERLAHTRAAADAAALAGHWLRRWVEEELFVAPR